MSKYFIGRKIVVVGPNGSGKTTFSKKLSQTLGLPHHELDFLYWKPDWNESSDSEFREKIHSVTMGKEWIVDGNYARNQDLTLLKADTIIWLDYPLSAITYRVVKRSVKRIFSGEPLWHGNRESIRRMFSRDSILLFAVRSFKRKSARYTKMMSDSKDTLNWIRIQNKKEEAEFWRFCKLKLPES